MTKKSNVKMYKKKRRRRNNGLNYVMITAIVCAIAIIAVLIGVNISKSGKKNVASSNQETTVNGNTSEPETTIPPTTKDPKVEISVMMIGDMLIHEGVFKSGMATDGTYNFDHLFSNILTDINACDIKIVNQETIFAGNDRPFTGYPTFNSPQELGDAEVKAGFNVVLHATNHTLDKNLSGVENCIAFWRTNHPNIAVLGINDTEDEYNNKIYVFEKEGFKVAILNYTYGTNGIPLPSSKPFVVNMLEREKITADVKKAKELADMVIVCPHWGTEYVYKPDSDQKYWTALFSNLEVDLVLGCHPHVLEPVEVVKNEATGHEMLVYYSLGNFVSNQDQKPRMIGGMANVTLVKDLNGCYIKDYSLTPIITHKLFGYKLITSYKISDYSEELAAGNAIRNDSGNYDFSLSYCHTLIKQILGDEYDENTGVLKVTLKNK